MKTILFVCTGNTCRSSMAEGIFKHMIKNRKDRLKDLRIMSAGTCAWEGDQVSPKAVEALKDKGIDIGDYRSTPLTPKLIKEADLILTMTLNHRAAVLQMCPKSECRVYTLKEYAAKDKKDLQVVNSSFEESEFDYDIRDPYGQAVDVYRKSADEIEEQLEIIIDRLLDDI